MILISPYSKKLLNGNNNPKNYPYWKEVIKDLKEVVQVGVDGEEKLAEDCRFNLPLKELTKLIKECDLWISVDNFFPHLAHHTGKKGIVLWGKSDPEIFGYKENINLLKSRDNLRNNQFDTWENEEFNAGVFVSPEEVICQIKKYQN